MGSGRAALRAQIARLKALGHLPEDVAPKVAKAVEREIRAQITAGRSPDGTPWPKTKDGRQPLQNAAKALRVRAIDGTIVASLHGVEARHHLGAVKGGVRRQILPTNALTDALTNAIRKVVDREFRAVMGAA